LERVAIAWGVRDIEKEAPDGIDRRAHLAGRGHRVKGRQSPFEALPSHGAITSSYRQHVV
jgi:hypothetical protein